MKFINPKKIVHSSKGLDNKENLLKEFPLQIELYTLEYTTFHDGDYVILDFGEEMSGGIRLFTSRVSAENKVRIRFGESVGETCADVGYKGATNDHSPRDFEVKLVQMSDLTFGQSGFRFVRLDFYGEEWKLRNAVACCTNDERKTVGTFVSNDKLLNKIWKTAEHTLRLNLHNGLFWDGVKRDRLCWIGDSYPEMRASICLYKDIPEIKNTLDFTAKTTPEDDWMNFLASYDLWWLLILADYYRYSGDVKYITEYREYVFKRISKFIPLIHEDGDTSFPMDFIDWPSHYDGGDGEELIKKADEHVGSNYLAQLAFKRIKECYKDINATEIVNLCDSLISKLVKATLKVQHYKQIAALGIYQGYDSKENEEVIMKDGAKGLSTFQSYFILSSVSHYGHYDEALNMLKEYYGGMLKVGSTTFWEDFDLEWLNNASPIDKMPRKGKIDIHGDYGKFCYKGYRHSLCHGWSSGVVAYLLETVVGLRIIDSTHYELKPHLSGLTSINCKVPTPYGVIHIKHNVVNNELKTEIVKCPKEITISE